MTALTWLALAAAVLLAPLPDTASARARALAGDDGPAVAGAGSLHISMRSLAVAAAALGAAATVTAALRFGPGPGLAAAAGCGTVAMLVRASLARRRAERRHRQLLAAARLLLAEIEAGARPEQALASAGGASSDADLAAAFGRAAHAAGRGADVGAVLAEDADVAVIGHAWRVAAAAGAPLAEVLAGVVSDLVARGELRHAVASALAGPRSSAALLAGLPLLGLLLGAAMGAHPWAFLTAHGAGGLVCCVGVVLDAAGVLWTQRLADRAERAC